MYWLAPGETVPCAVYPGDDVVVTALRADFSGVETVSLVVTGPDDSLFGRVDDVPCPERGSNYSGPTLPHS
jgi:hypothetical protein